VVLRLARRTSHGGTGPGWAEFLRSQAQGILALDFFTADLLNGTKVFVLAVIEHGSVRRQPRRLGRLSGPVGRRVRRRRRELVAAAAAHGVTNLRVFGSVARGQDGPDSDVDLLADLPPGMGLLGLGRVQADLEDILGTRVDLVAGELKPGIRACADRDLIPL